MRVAQHLAALRAEVSVLFNEPKLLKCIHPHLKIAGADTVSVLFNEPKLLKSYICHLTARASSRSFSALQRAEIAEIAPVRGLRALGRRFSALQRAEIAEIEAAAAGVRAYRDVSVLFNEPKLLKFCGALFTPPFSLYVSVLFNEPKLLKSSICKEVSKMIKCFSALQRAEIAEMS